MSPRQRYAATPWDDAIHHTFDVRRLNLFQRASSVAFTAALLCATVWAVTGCSDEVADGPAEGDADVVVDGGSDGSATTGDGPDNGTADGGTADGGTADGGFLSRDGFDSGEQSGDDTAAVDDSGPTAEQDAEDADSISSGDGAAAIDAGNSGSVDSGSAPPPGQLCMPCTKDVTCGGFPGAVCVSYGHLGSFCGTPCGPGMGANGGCPGGYDCRSIASAGGVIGKRCVRVDAANQPTLCGCSAMALQENAKTTCTTSGLVKGATAVCMGTRGCSTKGMTACSAPAPATETCNGIDDDCDGQTDEKTCGGQTACSYETCKASGGAASCVTTKLDGVPCDLDGNACSPESCVNGACKPGKKLDCNDANSCTADSCAKGKGCVNIPIAGGCDDGNVCSKTDTCEDGKCLAGAATECTDNDPCTADGCAPSSGCVFKTAPAGTACDDGNPCTNQDGCLKGKCMAGVPVACDDGTSCTTDTCDAQLGCRHVPAKPTANLCACKEPVLAGPVDAGFAKFGDNNYVKYMPGTLPVVITSPHGGSLKPTSIPNRTYGTLGNDSNSRETTYHLARQLALMTGRRPHVIINRLARIKLDANRALKEAAQGNKAAEQAWLQFHGFTEEAKKDITARCGKGLYIDMHTNGHKEAWTEIGIRLSSKTLASSDAKLDSAAVVKTSSLRSLATFSGVKHSALIRGPKSIGAVLMGAKIKTVPSPTYKHPAGGGYFNGGYNTERHGSKNGGFIDGIQIENHWTQMNAESKREKQGKTIAQAVLLWLKDHYGIDAVDGGYKAPVHERCAKAQKMEWFAGTATAIGSTTFATNEFGTAVNCGKPFALDGPQLYHEVALKKDQPYEFTFTADFGARVYVIAKSCDAKAISTSCKASPVNGYLLTTNKAKSFAFKPKSAGTYLVVIDSRAPDWHGAYRVDVKVVTP